MKLRFSPTSPYVRKVMICVIELGLENQVEKVATNPWSADTDLPDDNPLGKVPALALDDGNVLFDSPVICEYLDSLSDKLQLFPAGSARWAALRVQAMADGILDASVARFLEGKRDAGRQSESWLARQRSIVHRTLDVLEQEASAWGETLTIGHIATGAALGYVGFRFADDTWQQGRPVLSAWYDRFAARESMQQTVPVAPSE